MSTLSARSGQPYASSPNLSRVQESKSRSISNTSLKRIRSVSTTKIYSPNLQTRSEVTKLKTPTLSNLKRSIPKKISSSMAGISPTFGARKSFGLSSVPTNQVSGTYKPLTDRLSLGVAACKYLLSYFNRGMWVKIFHSVLCEEILHFFLIRLCRVATGQLFQRGVTSTIRLPCSFHHRYHASTAIEWVGSIFVPKFKHIRWNMECYF